MIYDIDLPVGAKKRLRELEELTVSEDLQLLTEEQPKYRPGYKQYLKSSRSDLEQFLDRLDNERRGRR